jgi:hypothetical protein
VHVIDDLALELVALEGEGPLAEVRVPLDPFRHRHIDRIFSESLAQLGAKVGQIFVL